MRAFALVLCCLALAGCQTTTSGGQSNLTRFLSEYKTVCIDTRPSFNGWASRAERLGHTTVSENGRMRYKGDDLVTTAFWFRRGTAPSGRETCTGIVPTNASAGTAIEVLGQTVSLRPAGRSGRGYELDDKSFLFVKPGRLEGQRTLIFSLLAPR